MEEILQHLGCINLVNAGINYQPQLVIAGFLVAINGANSVGQALLSMEPCLDQRWTRKKWATLFFVVGKVNHHQTTI